MIKLDIEVVLVMRSVFDKNLYYGIELNSVSLNFLFIHMLLF